MRFLFCALLAFLCPPLRASRRPFSRVVLLPLRASVRACAARPRSPSDRCRTFSAKHRSAAAGVLPADEIAKRPPSPRARRFAPWMLRDFARRIGRAAGEAAALLATLENRGIAMIASHERTRTPLQGTRLSRLAPAALLLAFPLGGCKGILDPHGPIGAAERLILFDSLAVMSVVVVPVIIATFAFAWWFRASNPRAIYRPDWAYSGTIELIVWAIPLLVITFLGGIAWFGSQALDPFARLPSKNPELNVQVVSLDWKWLFIYPNQRLATVERLYVPTGTPVHFTLTSDGVMNSFFVPQLGSQIYTMAEMTSQLSLQADQPGDYMGLSAQFSGQGFSRMTFTVTALPPADFARWVANAKATGPALDIPTYKKLSQPSAPTPMTYGSAPPGLFDSIVEEQLTSPGLVGGPGGQDMSPEQVPATEGKDKT
jgi:cytochrome o ubiquinol oxidase subunit 2